MKKIINIFLLYLLATTTAVAQSTATHRLRVKTMPQGLFFTTLQVYETSQFTGSPLMALRNDTTDIDVQVPAGAGVQLRIQVPNRDDDNYNNYTLAGWKANGILTELEEYKYAQGTFLWEMPDYDVELVGTFDYTPANPDESQQPAMGSWDPETGTLIIDGSSDSRYPLGFNYNDDRTKVLRYIRAGNYWTGNNKTVSFSAGNFPNCIFWDASRTNAASASCRFSNDNYTAVTEAVLPATITALEVDAFRHTRLQVLTLFAMTPPVNGASVRNYQTNQYEWKTAFPDCPDMTVRVPAEAVSLYQADEHWKDYNIVAMADDYVNLTVKLMEEADAATIAKYKNMSLVLTNKASGMKRRFVLTDRADYEFRYLTTNTTYSVLLLNSYDNEVARIDNIYLAEESKTVTLPPLRGVHTLEVTLTANGQPVGEALYSNTWYTASGEFIARGTVLPSVLDGEQLRYSLDIDQSLAMTYMVPAAADITVGQQADNIVLPLQPIVEKEVSFLVTDSLTQQGIANATITVAQLFSRGERGATVSLTTGSDGRATGRMLAVTSAITVNSPMHGSQSFAVNLAEAKAPIRVAFLQASGTTIQLSHTFQAAVAEGQEPTVQSGYDGGRNLEYTFTATLPDGRDSVITRYLVNYPLFTLYSDLPKGTKLRVQATSTSGAIEQVTAEATVGDGKDVKVVLPIVERGYIRASYYRTESRQPAVLVFNAAGELVKRMPFYDTEGKTMTLTNLPTGSYLVAAMSQGIQYANISSRQQLEMYEADRDYVAQQVSVTDGHITTVSFPRVPLATTQLESNLSERRAHWSSGDVTVGYNTGINVQVSFQGLKERMYGTNYDESLYPTDCRLEVYVPEGLTQPTAYRSYRSYSYDKSGHYSHSYMTHSGTIDDIKDLTDIYILNSGIYMTAATSQWNAAERKLTVEWPHIDEGGKMNLNMVPTLSKSFKPEIYLCYTLNGKPYREMLETNQLTVSRSSINVPELVVKPTFQARGKAMYYEESAGSRMKAASAYRGTGGTIDTSQYEYYEVTVMDGDNEIGKAQINSSGEWTATCTLPVANALSKHSIWAKIVYKNGVSYQTEAKQVTYDPNGVVPYTVKMSFFNHHPQHLQNTEVLFNLQTREATPRSYGYDNREGFNTDFTFEINLSNNDTTKVYAVDLAIFTKGPDAESFIIPAHYNARKNRWIAYHKFNTRSLPYNVNVRPYYYGDVIGSSSELQDAYDNFADWFQRDEHADSLANALQAYIDQINRAIDANDESLLPDPEKMIEVLDQMGDGDDAGDEVDPAEAEAIMAKLETTVQNMKGWEDVFGNGVPDLSSLGNCLEGLTYSAANGLTAEQLKADGYEEMLLDDGRKVYSKADEGNVFTFVDLNKNLVMRCDYDKTSGARGDMHREGALDAIGKLIIEIDDKISELKGYFDKIQTGVGALHDAIEIMIRENEAATKTAKAILRSDLKYKFSLASSSAIVRNAANVAKLEKETGILKSALGIVKKIKFDKLGFLSSLWGLVSDATKALRDLKRLKQIYDALPNPCPDDQTSRDELASDLFKYMLAVGTYQITVLANDVGGVIIAFASAAGASTGVLLPEGAFGIACSLLQFTLSYAASKIYDYKTENMTHEFAYRKSQLKCHKEKKKNDDDDDEECTGECGTDGGGGGGGDGDGSMGGGTDGSTGLLDPSGFVYEGVESNRLEGATTTVFYKANQNDATATVWDAENYGQVNPQLTDENGEYGWMVPTGWWQVKYEKQGYQTEYSEWLPVPPPQLDVNQGMTQMTMPVVSDVKTTTQAVTVTFDKYMLADTLNARRIFVTRGGQKVSGTVEPVLPSDHADAMRRLANRVRFVPETPLPANEQLTLTVKGTVVSYAGVEMGSDYQQEFDIRATVEKMVADTAINVIYDQGTALTLQALPAAAAAGKKVTARILSDMIASINGSAGGSSAIAELTLDSQGKATIVITGEAHGTTALILQMADDADIQTVVTVTVKEQGDFVCPMPKSNYLPNQSYPAGTQIELTCSLPGATILYTTDGSCPCSDENDVHTYTSPITLMADMVIKAIARAPGYEESDIAELTFMVEGSAPDTPVSYELVVADAGYATFYDSQRAYQLPAGLSASTVSGISGSRLNYQQLSGGIIPQGTAVLIEAQQKQAATYILTSTTAADGSPVGTNLLHGSDNATTTSTPQQDDDGYLFYKLAYGPSGTALANSFGWFWGTQQGAPFRIEGHRAWLAIPKQAGARAYLISSEGTDVPYVAVPQQQPEQMTDLQGRRLDHPAQPGVYIKDGRKVVVCGLRPK